MPKKSLLPEKKPEANESIDQLLNEAQGKLADTPVKRKHIIGGDGKRSGLDIQEVDTDGGGRVTIVRVVEDDGNK